MIPDLVGNLINLTELDLSHNKITEIPQSLRQITRLKRLVLEGNPLPINSEIIRKGWGEESWLDGDPQAVLNAYFEHSKFSHMG